MEMAQQVRVVVKKTRESEFGSPAATQRRGMVTLLCNHSTWDRGDEAETMDSRNQLASQPGQNRASGSVRNPVSKMNIGSARLLKPSSGLYMCTREHAHSHTQVPMYHTYTETHIQSPTRITWLQGQVCVQALTVLITSCDSVPVTLSCFILLI